VPGSTSSVLLRHPAAFGSTDLQLTASLTVSPQGFALTYRLRGELSVLRIPPPASAAPADGLWQNTCCEAFLATQSGSEYREFNFSPSGQWACYRFTDYRQRDEGFTPETTPSSEFQRLKDGFQLQAFIPDSLLPPGPQLQAGLTAVIELADGSKDYWALAHTAERPDFHLRQTFTLALSRP
jgi:hypothetical protein